MAGSEQRFHALVGKALTDPDFRAQLMSENVGEQKAALQSVGISGGYYLFNAMPYALTLGILVATCSPKRSLKGAPLELGVSR